MRIANSVHKGVFISSQAESITKNSFTLIRRAQVKVGLINLYKGLFSLNAHIYYKLKSGT
jgi:hypothetical protein